MIYVLLWTTAQTSGPLLDAFCCSRLETPGMHADMAVFYVPAIEKTGAGSSVRCSLLGTGWQTLLCQVTELRKA